MLVESVVGVYRNCRRRENVDIGSKLYEIKRSNF